jgi:hypothetical protein
VLVLAIVAAIPGLNLLTLGYLLDPQRRVATSGRLRDGFPLLVLAPRLGTVCFFTLLFMIPIRLFATRVSDAAVLLGPEHPRVQGMLVFLRIVQTMAGVHILLAIARGGRWSCFLRPFKNVIWCWRRMATREGRSAWDADIQQIIDVVRPVRHFVIGLKAFLGSIVWLLIPTGLLVSYAAPDRDEPLFGLLAFLGGVLMIPVAAWLPLLQVHQAVTGRFRSIFEVRAARSAINGAPLKWVIASILLYALTLPLYLAKIQLPPDDALLLATPFFILLIYPGRLLIAWTYASGMHQPRPVVWPLRWSLKLLMIPVLGSYAGFLFLTPFVSELGRTAPLENQAFLSPVPYAEWARR